MRRWLPVIVALGVSLGVIAAYLIAGGGSYKPLEVADPCKPRPPEVLAERGVFEGILLSGLDGAACELGVSREELTGALADDAALQEFSAEHEIDREQIEAAVRAGLIRAVNDAEAQGRLPTPIASIARGVADNAPISLVIDLFEAIPGDPSLAEVISALGDAGLTISDIGDAAIPQIEDLFDGLGDFGSGIGGIGDLLPEQLDPEALPGQVDRLRDDVGNLLPSPDEVPGLRDAQEQLDDLLP